LLPGRSLRAEAARAAPRLLKDTMNLAEQLNASCRCTTLDRSRLPAAIGNGLAASHPHLFAQTPVFLMPDTALAIADAVAALDRIARLPGWIDAALARRPSAAAVPSDARGAFMGYDFHLSEAGPRLIEVNTNAGGAFLHAAALHAHLACCSPMEHMLLGTRGPGAFAADVLAMFRSEWALARGTAPWRTVAIVDEAPQGQYLAPEFELARQLFDGAGIRAVVCDPAELRWDGAALRHDALGTLPVDLVYNRLTDFDLSAPASAALRAAAVAGATVLTPHPRAHAQHADKRNLVTLSDDEQLAAWGASGADRAVVRAAVPRTSLVTQDNADALWAARRGLFFKPATGFGSRAAWRGDKLTRRVWGEINAGDFVAQELVPPSERAVQVDGEPSTRKLDVRAYAYDGRVLLMAARLYAGQTTNFRTPAGGFAPVAVLPALATRS
jgi:hypothetical protein